MAGVSRTMWLRGIRADAAKMKANAHDDFKEATREISRKWKEGFRALKEENDSLQVQAKNRLTTELQSIDAMTAQQIAQGPPT